MAQVIVVKQGKVAASILAAEARTAVWLVPVPAPEGIVSAHHQRVEAAGATAAAVAVAAAAAAAVATVAASIRTAHTSRGARPVGAGAGAGTRAGARAEAEAGAKAGVHAPVVVVAAAAAAEPAAERRALPDIAAAALVLSVVLALAVGCRHLLR
jgi:hypothetical protein